jgi:hypothetical protein
VWLSLSRLWLSLSLSRLWLSISLVCGSLSLVCGSLSGILKKKKKKKMGVDAKNLQKQCGRLGFNNCLCLFIHQLLLGVDVA